MDSAVTDPPQAAATPETANPQSTFTSNSKLVVAGFVVSVPILWIILLIRNWTSGIVFPLVFLPTIVFLGIWKYYRNSSTADLPLSLLGYVTIEASYID
jgi:hypothetical protein